MKKTVLFISALLALGSCDLSKKSTKSTTKDNMPSVMLDSVVIKPKEPMLYQASAKRANDILHTRLDVRFDWAKAYLYGKATITVKPYFYPVASLQLDARGMEIKEVSIAEMEYIRGPKDKAKEPTANRDYSAMKIATKKPLQYKYEKNVIDITLDREYKSSEEYTIYIEYVSKPNELEEGGSAAINSDKGLYFINPDGKEPNKPQQIWTQGETQSNSAWFPTIDRPNERMTDEIYMTVDKKYVTLSNGELAFQTDNGDGTRTDYWRMDLPHAPYLVMMAVGDFAVVKDKWKDKEVNYYVEKEYEQHAKAIFGNTPEMLELYSNTLGVQYPWNKYSQIIVRDYVSGAMENTTATIHGEFLQRTTREMLDGDNEDVVAHELFHQWFGDYVTCESWSNLPLNESFATYGEYLWIEHKYGRDEADMHIQQDMQQYLAESMSKQVDMIRFYYEDREDMFDGHSYQKGGRILHMLRRYVGDDAFFASLKYYLETNKYTAVEIHNLRLAFEHVTGEDLNWFFNQWFLSSGHPDLEIKYNYDASLKKETVTLVQKQKRKETPLYTLPMAIDIYANGKKERHNIVMTKSEQEFVFDVAVKPDLVNVDAEKMLLAQKTDNKSKEEYIFQYKNAPLYMDRYEALNNLRKSLSDSLSRLTLISALDDKFWNLRIMAINALSQSKGAPIKDKLIQLAQKDEKAKVRAAAMEALSKLYSGEDLLPVFKAGLNDQSYNVLGESMLGISEINPGEAMKVAKQFENETSPNILINVARIYADHGTEEQNDFFLKAEPKVTGYNKIGFLSIYAGYLQRSKDETINAGLPMLEKNARNNSNKWTKFYAQKAIGDLAKMYKEREDKLQLKITEMKSTNTDQNLLRKSEEDLKAAQEQRQKLDELYKSVKAEK
jgi:aminopeptidase N